MSTSTQWTVRIPSKKSRGEKKNSGYLPLGLSEEELEQVSLKELRAMCAKRGLSKNHNRERLVARLQKYVWANQPVPKGSRFADWDCSCGAKGCFGSRATCYKCGKENPARKQAGDWSCPTCKAHCFASRSSCFKCGTQNPKNVTVTFLAEHVFTGKGKQDVIAKAKTDFAVQQQKERKQQAALRKFEQQRKAAEKLRAKAAHEVHDASTDSGSVTSESTAITVRSSNAYFRGGRSYWLLRNGCVREKEVLKRDAIEAFGAKKARFYKNKEVDSLPVGTRVYVEKVVGTRAKITSPIRGWISTTTARGDLLKPVRK